MNNNNNNMSSIDFSDIGIQIPETVYCVPLEEQRELYNYLNQMNNIQKKAYLIAFNHLGTSFNIFKSNGYKEWKNKNK